MAINQAAASKQNGQATPAAKAVNEMPDAVFRLIEDMAVLMREKTLRCSKTLRIYGEEKLLQYFETCGTWFCGDGTLVSEFYYLRLPAQAFCSLAESRT